VLVEFSDLGDVFRNGRDEDLAAVTRVALAAHQACLFQPVHHAGDGAGGQTGQFRQPARGHTPVQIEEIETFEVGTRNADPAGNRLPENHAQRRGPPHGVFQFLH